MPILLVQDKRLPQPPLCAAWCPRYDLLALAFPSPELSLYRLSFQKAFSTPLPSCPAALAWTPDGRLLIVSDAYGKLTTLSVHTLPLPTLAPAANPTPGAPAIPSAAPSDSSPAASTTPRVAVVAAGPNGTATLRAATNREVLIAPAAAPRAVLRVSATPGADRSRAGGGAVALAAAADVTAAGWFAGVVGDDGILEVFARGEDRGEMGWARWEGVATGLETAAEGLENAGRELARAGAAVSGAAREVVDVVEVKLGEVLAANGEGGDGWRALASLVVGGAVGPGMRSFLEKEMTPPATRRLEKRVGTGMQEAKTGLLETQFEWLDTVMQKVAKLRQEGRHDRVLSEELAAVLEILEDIAVEVDECIVILQSLSESFGAFLGWLVDRVFSATDPDSFEDRSNYKERDTLALEFLQGALEDNLASFTEVSGAICESIPTASQRLRLVVDRISLQESQSLHHVLSMDLNMKSIQLKDLTLQVLPESPDALHMACCSENSVFVMKIHPLDRIFCCARYDISDGFITSQVELYKEGVLFCARKPDSAASNAFHICKLSDIGFSERIPCDAPLSLSLIKGKALSISECEGFEVPRVGQAVVKMHCSLQRGLAGLIIGENRVALFDLEHDDDDDGDSGESEGE